MWIAAFLFSMSSSADAFEGPLFNKHVTNSPLDDPERPLPRLNPKVLPPFFPSTRFFLTPIPPLVNVSAINLTSTRSSISPTPADPISFLREVTSPSTQILVPFHFRCHLLWSNSPASYASALYFRLLESPPESSL